MGWGKEKLLLVIMLSHSYLRTIFGHQEVFLSSFVHSNWGCNIYQSVFGLKCTAVTPQNNIISLKSLPSTSQGSITRHTESLLLNLNHLETKRKLCFCSFRVFFFINIHIYYTVHVFTCEYVTWWNFLLTLRYFSMSFFVRTFNSLPSIIWDSNAEEYCLSPRSFNHTWDTHRWSIEEISGYFLQKNKK